MRPAKPMAVFATDEDLLHALAPIQESTTSTVDPSPCPG
jgi:hypothetical protein